VADEERTLVGISALCFLQHFYTCLGDKEDVWPLKVPVPLILIGSLLEQVEEETTTTTST